MIELSGDIRSWAASLIGGDVSSAEQLVGGASRTSFVITCADGQKYFLRMDLGNGPLSGTRYSLAREYGVLEFLQGKGIPIAGVLGYSADHDAILMEFVPGYTSYDRASSPVEQATLQRDLLAAIVKLQAVDPSSLVALGASAAPLGEAVRLDLAEWAELYRTRVTPCDPLLAFALNWLGRRVPDEQTRPVIVHGDVGPGNFLIDRGRVRALIDWEMVRIGHPLEDLACIIARGLGADFGTAHEHIAHYEHLTGARVDLGKLDYALALVLTRWTIAISMALSRPSAAQNVPMLFAFRQINARALVEIFCRAYAIPGLQKEAVLIENRSTRVATIYCGEVLAELSEKPTLSSADRHKLAGVGDLLSYLASFIDYGPETYAAEEAERIKALVAALGDDPQQAVCDLASSVELDEAGPLVAYLQWRTMREHGIMRATLGARADNVIALGKAERAERPTGELQ